jgi:hypothetical protein
MRIKLVFAVFFVIFLVWGATRIVKNVVFDREIEGYLKRAGDSNTVELAIKNLEVAVENIKSNGMTSGYTSILYRTPDEDVGFWFENIETSLKELRTITSDASQLERSNVLMKLRETLLDHNSHGVGVTVPAGITICPNNMAYLFWALSSLILAVVFGVLFISDDDY